MNWHPQLVALDIDGTLLDHDGRMPDQVHRAVRAVVDAGTPVVLATGRGWIATRPIADQLGLPPGPHVSSNGAVLVDYPPARIRTMATFDAAPVVNRVLELVPNAALAVEMVGEGWRLNKAFPQDELTGRMELQSVDQLVAEPVTRLVIRDPDADWAQFEHLAEQVGLHRVSYAIGWSTWLDIAPEGITKASGLEQICTELGVDPSGVLALGDGFNDVEMLHWAGRGVALGDAHADVRAAADHTTDRFDHGGTVNELGRWFPVASPVAVGQAS